MMAAVAEESDLASALERQLSSEALAVLKDAARLAQGQGCGLYLVGGPVRDLLLDRPSLDLDLVVEGDAPVLVRSLARELGGRTITHRRFGTATVHARSIRIDLATARTEVYPRPGALPQVRPGSVGDDLRRRDFTINSMALSLAPAAFGELLDPLGGRLDLDAGLVRVIHDQSFIDDATRVLRAVRYEQRFGFNLEAGTESLLRRDVGLLQTISGDRVRHELLRILEEIQPEKVMGRAHELGILRAIHPALQWEAGLSRLFAQARREGVASAPLYLALLASTLGEAEVEGVTERLRLPGAQAGPFRDGCRLASVLPSLEAAGLRPSQLYQALEGYALEAVRACRIAAASATVRERLALFLDRLREVRPSLDGRNLMELGVPEGPLIGQALEELRRARLDGEVGTREEEVALIMEWLRKSAASEK